MTEFSGKQAVGRWQPTNRCRMRECTGAGGGIGGGSTHTSLYPLELEEGNVSRSKDDYIIGHATRGRQPGRVSEVDCKDLYDTHRACDNRTAARSS